MQHLHHSHDLWGFKKVCCPVWPGANGWRSHPSSHYPKPMRTKQFHPSIPPHPHQCFTSIGPIPCHRAPPPALKMLLPTLDWQSSHKEKRDWGGGSWRHKWHRIERWWPLFDGFINVPVIPLDSSTPFESTGLGGIPEGQDLPNYW